MSLTVVCQKWEESESGWGCRPIGYTLHATRAHHYRFVTEFWRRQKETLGEDTPAEYTREDGEPYECPVTAAVQAFVVASEDGVWGGALAQAFPRLVRNGGISPWPGGRGGWRSTINLPPRLDLDLGNWQWLVYAACALQLSTEENTAVCRPPCCDSCVASYGELLPLLHEEAERLLGAEYSLATATVRRNGEDIKTMMAYRREPASATAKDFFIT
jgi:hypothetical protein